MKRVYLTVFLTICMYVFLAGTQVVEGPLCYHFTWPGARFQDLDCEKHNEDNLFTPCIKPIHPGHIKPNLTEIWKTNKTYMQPMELGSVCVKYTYVYNNAVVNVSYFCGRVTEDQTTPIESGCYVKYTEGYSIEACACKSNSNSKPCNSTIKNTCSLLIIFVAAAVSLFMYKISEIP